MRQTVFGKTTRPHGTNEAPTYRELTVANTLNQFDLGGGIRVNELVVEEYRETAVAFTQNQRCEVRLLGDRAGAVQARPGMKQQTFVLICEG